MRVVFMVPSWTETLIECGVNVVGRTRYCVHPADRVAVPDAVLIDGEPLCWFGIRSLRYLESI
ncbi:hypothetical protein HNR62_002845 [Oceanisphaera litoralis]|uniref:hypothetical protein n=1 Tax=Oceanisphaera litoralis TaxID=225144 RepID=UPI00195D1B27|nr:hypothetical protein [Oceanisphaera litoralis]MBM7456943.1 hypothetical protein [Oceanisphaera litoralis]